MNIRKIVTYNALRRQFTVEELAFAEVLFNATESERELLITALQPEKPAGKKASKKSSKSSQSETERVFERCDTCGLTKRADVHKDSELGGYHEFMEKKSPRASGMAAQLKERRQEQREPMVTTKDDDYGSGEQRCTVLRGDLGGTVCGLLPDHNVHHLQSSRGFHSFVPSTTAPPAPVPSPANGGVVDESESESESVSAASGD